MQPSNPRGPGAGALLLAFVAGALGGAAGALLVRPHSPAAESAEDAGLRRSIDALDETVGALGLQVAGLGRSPAPADAPPIEPLAPGETLDPGLREFVATAQIVTKLENVVRLLEQRAGGGASDFPGSASLPLLDAAGAAADRGALVQLAREENDATRPLWRRHAFWTCQQVLDAYGLPDQIEAGDGMMGWYYDTGERTLHFEFHEGMLVNLWN